MKQRRFDARTGQEVLPPMPPTALPPGNVGLPVTGGGGAPQPNIKPPTPVTGGGGGVPPMPKPPVPESHGGGVNQGGGQGVPPQPVSGGGAVPISGWGGSKQAPPPMPPTPLDSLPSATGGQLFDGKPAGEPKPKVQRPSSMTRIEKFGGTDSPGKPPHQAEERPTGNIFDKPLKKPTTGGAPKMPKAKVGKGPKMMDGATPAEGSQGAYNEQG